MMCLHLLPRGAPSTAIPRHKIEVNDIENVIRSKRTDTAVVPLRRPCPASLAERNESCDVLVNDFWCSACMTMPYRVAHLKNCF